MIPSDAQQVAGAALLCHPHPLHGGTMHTKALHHAARAMVEVGLPVLRFNFRGVGRSAGTHTGGPGERDDARAALAWLAARFAGPLLAGGFSFGSWVGLEVGNAEPRVAALLAIAPPLHLYDFDFLASGKAPVFAVAGDRDPICPAPDLERFAARFAPRVTTAILPGAEHLLTAHLGPLHAAVLDFARAHCGRL
jgi:hypothetical protein